MPASAAPPAAGAADPARCPPAGPDDRITRIDAADLAGTAALAGRLAATLAGEAPAGVLCLWGPLGAGKTAMVRALIAAAAGRPVEVPSPTFTLVQTYDLPAGPLWHFDLYRLASAEEVYELGWEEALADGLVAVEWPDRLGPLLPRGRLDLVLGVGPAATDEPDPGEAGEPRRFDLIGRGTWAGRVVDRLTGRDPR